MSNDFKKVSILDDRLMTTDSLNYGVFRGGQNVTNVRMPAISVTDNALNFVIPFPSESTVLDREVYLQTTTRYLITFPIPLPGKTIYSGGATQSLPTNQGVIIGYQCPLVLGSSISVRSFPTQRSMETIQVQINNDIQTINVGDVLPALMRCSDKLSWEKNNITASQASLLARCNDEIANNIGSSMGSYDLVQGNKVVPNGCQGILTPLVSLPVNANDLISVFDYGQLTATPGQASGETGTRFFMLTYTSTEPLLAPPFIWNHTESNRMGVYGIQNLSIVCNYAGNITRSIAFAPEFRTCYNVTGPPRVADLYEQSPVSVGGTIAFIGVQGSLFPVNDAINPLTMTGFGYAWNGTISQQVLNAELQMKYITPHGTDVKPLRNVLPLLQYPRFISNQFSSSGSPIVNAAQNNYFPAIDYQIINPSPDITLASQTFTLNQVPDKLLIFVRPDSNVRNNPAYNDFAMSIKNIVIQWNNHAGILANASQEQLFLMSKEAGSNQDWLQFKGLSNSVQNRNASALNDLYKPLPILAITSNITYDAAPPNWLAPLPSFYQYATVGSYLMLDVAKHMELQEPYYAPGSLGSFQLQMNITCYNTVDIQFNPEIVIIPINSGIMVTEKGQTSSYTGILTKSDVLDSALQEPYGQLEIKRLVGHGHGDSSMALPTKVVPKHRNKNLLTSDGSRMSNRLM